MEDETSAFVFVRIFLRAVKDVDLPDPYTPYVYGSVPVFGSWNSSKAVPLQQVSLASWEIECILPSMHEAFDLKFLFKHNGRFLTEDDSHKFTECKTGSYAKVSVPGRPPESIEFQVAATSEKVSAFALGASWKAYKNGQSPRSPENKVSSLEDISRYAVPAPSSGGKEYAADSAANPRDIQRSPVRFYESRGSPRSLEQPQFVDRAVGSSPAGLVRIGSDVSVLNGSLDGTVEDMPAASGAVAAGAVADKMLGPKERRRLAIVLVGLPARGKTFTAAKLTRYLRWLGHDTKHFNVGKYRRLKHGSTQNADFFRADNLEGVDARNEVASLAMEDMLAWMDEGGQVGVFDATNSTKLRRKMLLNMAEGRCQVIFLETICRDPAIIEHNIRLKVRKSPDYSDQPDYEAALSDFKTRLVNYAKAYEPVDEGSYIKMIDKVSEQDGQMQVNNISGYLPGRIVFFLVNSNLTPRPILLTRHGESVFNLNGRIGGDPVLTEAGEEYALKLARFINQRLKSQQTASIWTSTLRRTILTARHIVGFPTVQWRALDEIDAGVCDGMTYEEIRETMPDEYKARKLDKLRYRYPRGESYLDVIQRLEPVIVELERQRSPVVVVAHQAILRSLYAYFTDKPLNEIPHVEIPLHTIIEIQMGVAGVQEKRYKLMEGSTKKP